MKRPLFLDVTNCAIKGARGGIPRISRELYQALRAVPSLEVRPVIWEPSRASYATPCFFHHRNLRPRSGSAFGRNRASVPFWQRQWRIASRGRRLVGAGALEGGLLLLTETFGDARIEWIARYRAENPGARIAAIFYDAIPWTHAHLTPGPNRSRFEDYMAALAACDVVLCISAESRGDLQRFWAERGIAAARAEVIHCPLTTVASPDAEPLSAASHPALRGSPIGDPFLLFVSSLEPRKNHLTLLKACEALWREGVRFDLVLVGQMLQEGSGPILAEIERLRAEPHCRPVSWLRETDDGLLHELYRRALFTVYPSIKEGFGLPILESLAFGKPCVCSGAGAIGEVAAEGGCRLVDVADAGALAGAIRELLESPAERERLAKEAEGRRYRTWIDYRNDFLRIVEPRRPFPPPAPAG